MESAGETALAILADGRIEVNGKGLEAQHLIGLSAEMDVLVDVEAFAQAMGWAVTDGAEGGRQLQMEDHLLAWDYTLTETGALDLVNLTCDGEPVELTEAMTALVNGRLYLAPLWLEVMGAQPLWEQDTLTLKLTIE